MAWRCLAVCCGLMRFLLCVALRCFALLCVALLVTPPPPCFARPRSPRLALFSSAPVWLRNKPPCRWRDLQLHHQQEQSQRRAANRWGGASHSAVIQRATSQQDRRSVRYGVAILHCGTVTLQSTRYGVGNTARCYSTALRYSPKVLRIANTVPYCRIAGIAGITYCGCRSCCWLSLLPLLQANLGLAA